ncbi:hypothetical protein C8J57DRAFT_1331989 [Mycena rebaudengoi]|nr:hypothetical protein C8J57DRAFT_1331989 [Mycena rebaudengoi]
MTQLNVNSYGIDILYRSVVMEALHDSGERFPEPACHPGTRTRVLEELRAWRGHPKRGTWNGLFTSLAYQLATSVSELHLPVQQAVEADKLVVGRAMTDHKIQQKILHLFITVIRDYYLPVRLLITSRPEPHLPEFSRIYHEFLARGTYLGPGWPAREAVMHLVEKSSGIFIYAATVIRIIGDEYTHPAERLAAVLSLDPSSTAPLDDLYTEVLSVVPPEVTRLRTQDNHFIMRPEHIEIFFQLPPGSARLALRALQSFVHPLHASLGDYLGDPRRSGRWCVLVSWLHSDFLHCALRLLRDEQAQNTIFSRFEDLESWPKQGSGYPKDLIQLWEDHWCIAELVDCPLTTNQAPPTYNFDPVYREILSGNLNLLFLLRLKIIIPNLTVVLVFLGPRYNPQVFQPVLKIHKSLRLCSNLGDLPVKFLADPRRARNLYLAPQDIFEDLVLLCIRNTRKTWLNLLNDCRPSSKISHELESFDLAQICDPRNINPIDHHRAHAEIFSYSRPDDTGFPDPPLQAIAFWERQKVMIDQCDGPS